MTDKPITHKSRRSTLNTCDLILEKSNKNGVKCDWIGYITWNGLQTTEISLKWNFDWTELQDTGIDSLSGHITVTSCNNTFNPQKIDIDFTSEIDSVRKDTLSPGTFHDTYPVYFEYSLIPHKSTVYKNDYYDEIFMPSELNDTILVIDGRKLHVHKGFLSVHSEFFRALFSSNFKDGQRDEIPIQDVSYENFGLLMSAINPKTVFPNDKTVVKLLELADRFLMPAVVCQCEHHLMNMSKIELEEKIWMADKYNMPMLLETCVSELNTAEKTKKVGSMEKFSDLSKETILKIHQRTLQFINF